MNENVNAYMAMAEECLEAARTLFEAGSYRNAAGRAYYAYFDAVRALLSSKGIAIKSHSAIRGLFSENFVKDGPFLARDAKQFYALFVLRQNTEYNPDEIRDIDSVSNAIEITAEFLLQTEVYLKQNGFTS